MEVLEKGHVYKLRNKLGERGDPDENKLTFVNQEKGSEHNGTTTQEVIRALIDRTRHCNNCMPHPNNERIVHHLRMALTLHEARALERKVEKGELPIEHYDVGDDAHLALSWDGGVVKNATPDLTPYTPDWERKPNHPKRRG